VPNPPWTADEAKAELEQAGEVWDIGQLSKQAIKRLNKVGRRHKAAWPWYFVGTCHKACWLHPDNPLQKFEESLEDNAPQA